MPTYNDTQLTAFADAIKNATAQGSNTATIVGQMLDDIISNKINSDKIDTTVTLGSSDTLVPSQLAVKTYVDTVIRTVKVSLSSAQILALNSTPVSLVAAPGSGKMILPLAVTYYLHAGGIVYATQTDLNLSLAGSIDTTSSGLLSSAADKIEVRSPVFTVNNASSIDAALFVRVNTANPTAGNGTLDVYVTYSIISI